MKEYKSLITEYSSDKYLIYTKVISEENWGDQEVAEKFLEKYWLPEKEYIENWKSLQDQIFINQNNGLPDSIFAKPYKILALRGGCLFVEDDFKYLQKCLLEIGDKYFVIIQNTFGKKLINPTAFRMKFPSNITWDELMSGNFISTALFEMFHNEFFVFGESDMWGKYAANEYIRPLDIIGVKPIYFEIFKNHFKQSEGERLEINTWLPPGW